MTPSRQVGPIRPEAPGLGFIGSLRYNADQEHESLSPGALMRRYPTSTLIIAVLIASCTTLDPDRGEWAVEEEPTSQPLPEGLPEPPAPAPREEPEEAEEVQGPTEPVLNPNHDCPPFDPDTWSPEDFDFHVYRHLACQRSADQDILFSPALTRIALAELAVELGGADGQAIADLLDFPDPESLHSAMEEYRQDLLSRMPTPSNKYFVDWHVPYTFDENDPERLWQALGVEFFSQLCDPPNDSCAWIAQNDRWGASFLHTVDYLDSSPESSAAMLFRGQLESYIGPLRRPSNPDYQELLRANCDAMLLSEEMVLSELEFLGDDLSLLLFHTGESISLMYPDTNDTANQSVSDVEDHLSHQTLQEALGSLKPAVRSFQYVHWFPLFDIQETSQLGEYLRLPYLVPLTTRIHFDREGINDPERLTLELDPPYNHVSGAGRSPHAVLTYDEPFLFMIYDHPTESILVMGRVSSPLQK